MADIVTLADYRRSAPEPGLSGEAHCLACGHDFMAASAPGAIDLPCPKCRLPRGVYQYPIAPDPGEQMFACGCGCTTFFFTAQESEPLLAVCIACGAYHEPGVISRLGQGLS